MMKRRTFLQWAGWGVSVGGLAGVANAIEPFRRAAAGRWKIGLAGYSLRDFFQRPEGSPDRLDLFGFIDYCAKLGVDGAELTQYYFPANVSDEFLLKLKRHAHVVGVDLCGGAIRNNLTVDPQTELAAQLEHIKTWASHYAKLGAPVIRVFAGEPAKGLATDEAIDRVVHALGQACAMAGQYGVMLGIENHDFTTNVDHLINIVERVDSPWLGINFDSGNFNASRDPYDQMRRMAPYAVNVQFKVTVHAMEGAQPADWGKIVDILRAANYAGYVTLEYEEAEAPYEAIPRHIGALREAIRA